MLSRFLAAFPISEPLADGLGLLLPQGPTPGFRHQLQVVRYG